MTKKKEPDPVHPGEVLREELRERGMTQALLAEKSGLTPKHISMIVTGKSGIGTQAAHRLETVLGISARAWIRMQADYDVTHGRTRTRH
jgi:HTH-type transcriptional regulator/antitoxin HigA